MLNYLRMTHSAEILESIPISGTIEEVDFSPETNDVLWVRFRPSDSADWCGKFKRGIKSNFNQVHILNDEILFLLAGGQGYFVNAKLRKIEITEFEDLEEFIVDQHSRTVIATDGLGILLLQPETPSWESERFSYDGIQLSSVENGTVFGTYNDLSDTWPKFRLKLAIRRLRCEGLPYLKGNTCAFWPQLADLFRYLIEKSKWIQLIEFLVNLIRLWKS
jgi:hypothetical protein